MIGRLTWKALWPFFWGIPGTPRYTGDIVFFHGPVPLKVDVLGSTGVADTGIKVHWQTIPLKHNVVVLWWLQ